MDESLSQAELAAVLAVIEPAKSPLVDAPCTLALLLAAGPGTDLRLLQEWPISAIKLADFLPTPLIDKLIDQLVIAARQPTEGELASSGQARTLRRTSALRVLEAQRRLLWDLFYHWPEAEQHSHRIVVATDASIRHAFYFKALLPACTIVCCVSDPYDAYRRVKAREAKFAPGVERFAVQWRRLATDFIDNARLADAELIRVEGDGEAAREQFAAAIGLDTARLSDRPVKQPPESLPDLPRHDTIVLKREAGGLAQTLGYAAPDAAPAAASALHLGPPMDPKRCVVLVPVGSHIEPQCEAGLVELERRGYQVRRVRGYSAIDQGRNQLATDALADGFAETMWIDSDIAFQPDAVERLRSHRVPLVSGIYPQKGRRALACHAMPGTADILFGPSGGLIELLYAPAGFLLVRREAYEAIQRELALPVCNERDGHAMLPYFQPLVRELDGGHWYLAEDFAFCERARRAGLRILADTTVRLYHIGSFGYGWEDAGSDRQRYENYNFRLTGAPPSRSEPRPRVAWPAPPQEAGGRLETLKAAYPWPAVRPEVPPRPTQGWLSPSTQELLQRTVQTDHRLIIELGAFLGLATRHLAALAPGATIVSIDHWRGSSEHRSDASLAPLLPVLFETFLANCWSLRERLIPMRMLTLDGLREVARHGLAPDLVYVDADHAYDAVKADIEMARRLFPRAALVGDDWDWDGVRKAVSEIAERESLKLETHGVGWRLL